MKVLNLFGGPGCGKSTTAAGLFYIMKSNGARVELVTEYPKELTYDGDWETLRNQRKVLMEQSRRQLRLIGHVDYVVTDCPLLLGSIYVQGEEDTPKFHDEVQQAFDFFDNANFLLRAKKPYQAYGRTQSEEEARAIDVRIKALLDGHGRDYVEVDGDYDAPWRVLRAFRAMDP